MGDLLSFSFSVMSESRPLLEEVSLTPAGNKNEFPLELRVQHVDVFVRRGVLPFQQSKGDAFLRILHDMRVLVKPGQMMAILGSSGSGKTTLLNTLAGRMRHDLAGTRIVQTRVGQSLDPPTSVTSSFYYDSETGQNIPVSKLSSRISYVMQDDRLLPHLTCYETLYYAGMLRLPRALTKVQKEEKIQQVILELGLRDCAHTRVGSSNSSGERLSGGERRRLSIAVQLLTHPSILFLDEPTSGLDSFTANRLMNTLLKIAHEQNRTIICTIHQPRTEVLNMFDKALLLSRGRIVYFGASNRMIPYFGRLGYHCPPHVNPADYLLDQISVDPRNDKVYAESKQRLRELIKAFNDSPESAELTQELDRTPGNVRSRQKKTFDQQVANWPEVVSILVRRSYKSLFRNPTSIITRIAQVMAFAIILSLCYTRIGNDQIGIQNMQGFLYECFALVFVGILNANACYLTERDVFYRERSEGAYGTSAFFTSYMLAEVPFEFASVLGYTLLTYAVIGLKMTWTAYFVYLSTIFCLTFSGESLGIMLCSIFSNVGLSNTVATILTAVGLVACGSFIPISSMSWPIQLMDTVLVTTYLNQVLYGSQLTGATYVCPGDQALPDGSCPLSTGEEVLESMGVNPDYLWPCFGTAVALTISYRVIAYIFLRFKPVAATL